MTPLSPNPREAAISLLDLFSDSNEKSAAKAQKRGITQGRTAALGNLATGEADLRSGYTAGDAYYQPYAQAGDRASTLYSDALGLNGADGNARAVGAFQTGPGYDFALQQGEQSVLRNASARGGLAGGGTSADLMKYGQGLANQEYGSWADRLQSLQAQGANIAGARAGASQGLGQQLLGLAGTRADLNWAAETGLGNADARYKLSKDASGANIFGAITGGLSLGAKLLGIGGGGGLGIGAGSSNYAKAASGFSGLT